MKHPIHLLSVLALGALSVRAAASEPTPPGSAAGPIATQDPSALADASPARSADEADAVESPNVASREQAPAFEDQRSPAEVAAPFDLPEDERTCPSPYRPDLALDLPLSVDGEAIPVTEVERHLCLGFGYAYSAFAKYQVLIDEELARRAAAGEDLSRYTVTDADLEQFLTKQREEFATRYPTLDFAVEVGRVYISYDLYREPARQSIQFDRLFLPENPADWPELTTELIRGAGGEEFVQDAFDSYARRKQKMDEEGLDELPPEDPILVSFYKDVLLGNLHEFAQIETSPARLPEGVLMTVEGKEIPIAQVWGQIGPYVSAMDLDWTRRLLVNLKALEHDFAERGALLGLEDFESKWPEQGLTYRQMVDRYREMAPLAVGTRSMEAYVAYARLIESLRREMGDKLEDEALLREWSGLTNEVTGVPKRDIEMILCAAWDGDLAAWKPNGWAQARAKAFELKAALDEDPSKWTDLRELHSEFWDPPMPETGHTPIFSLRSKGAFGQQTRNQLLGMVEENEGFELVYGQTVTDEVFYDQEMGTTVGPRMGPKGYYIMRLTGRTPPMRPLDLTNPMHRSLIQNYYLRVQLDKRAHELVQRKVAAGKVQGI